MSDLAASFLDRVSARFGGEGGGLSPADWVCKNTTIGGRPFTFKDFPFQEEIMNDMHPDLCCEKVSQCGLSEVQIRKQLAFLKRHNGTTAIFTLPTDPMFKRTSQTRVKPILETDGIFNQSVGQIRSMNTYQIDQSFLHITNCSEGAATSIAADMVMIDEIDLSDPQMVALFQSRTQASSYKIHQDFSTPTYSGFGIQKSFSASDQKLYMCKCGSCGTWNSPEFSRDFLHIEGLSPDLMVWEDLTERMLIDNDVRLDRSFVKCISCGSPLDLEKGKREWVAKFASRTNRRGYRVSPFTTHKLGIPYILKQLFKYKELGHIRGWFNTVIGQAFTASDTRLRADELEGLFGQSSYPEIGKDTPLAVGIDMGLICHVVVGAMDAQGGKCPVVRFIPVPAKSIVQWVKDFCDSHNVVCGSVDRHPYTPTANEIFEVSGKKIIPCEYRGLTELNPVFIDDDKKVIGHVQVNRTMAIDKVVKMIRNSNTSFHGYGDQKQTVMDHLQDMVREEEPEKQAVWIKLSGNDHYFHAMAFMLVGIQIQFEFMAAAKPAHTSLIIMGAAFGSAHAKIKNNPQPLSGPQLWA